MYEESARVPLIAVGEGFAPGRVVATPAVHTDIAPWVLAATGAPDGIDELQVPGCSLVDLADGGGAVQPYQRGVWLFPPAEGRFDWSAVEDAGDGHGALDCWTVAGIADSGRVVLTVRRDGPGWGGDAITVLLPPGDARSIDVNGGDGRSATHGDRRGIAISVAKRP